MDKRWTERIKLRHMRTMLAIEAAGSLTGAARRLYVSQAAVSKVVAEAEALFGVALLERRGRGVVLTEAGQAFAASCRRIMLELRLLGDEVERLGVGASGVLNIGLQAVSVLPLLVNVVARVKTHHPNATLRLIEGRLPEVLAGLRAGQYDLAFGRLVGKLLEHDLEGMPLWVEPYVVVASVGHPVLALEQPTWTDLLRHRWCLPLEGTPVREHLRLHLAQLMLPEPSGAVESSTLATMLALLGSMSCVTLLPRYAAAAGQLRGELAMVPLALPAAVEPIGLIWRHGVPLSPTARMFREETRLYIDKPMG